MFPQQDGPWEGAGAAAPGSRAEHRAVRMSSTSGLPAGSLNSEGGVSADGASTAPPGRLGERLQNRSVCWITMLVGNKNPIRRTLLMLKSSHAHIIKPVRMGLLGAEMRKWLARFSPRCDKGLQICGYFPQFILFA